MQRFEFLRQPLLGELAMSPERKKEREKEKKMPFVVATYVYASSQGQRTHSARTKTHSSSLSSIHFRPLCHRVIFMHVIMVDNIFSYKYCCKRQKQGHYGLDHLNFIGLKLSLNIYRKSQKVSMLNFDPKGS